MPITTSAKKALRGSLSKRKVNSRLKSNILDNTKKLRKLIAEKKGKEASEFLKTVQKALDKAVKSGYIKKNTASRKKSRLSAQIKKISQ
jgi:small subunit ribosomal protein S20